MPESSFSVWLLCDFYLARFLQLPEQSHHCSSQSESRRRLMNEHSHGFISTQHIVSNRRITCCPHHRGSYIMKNMQRLSIKVIVAEDFSRGLKSHLQSEQIRPSRLMNSLTNPITGDKLKCRRLPYTRHHISCVVR